MPCLHTFIPWHWRLICWQNDADNLGSVTRTVLETVRTLFVWLAGLALFYSPWGGNGKLGEAWDQYSWLQVRPTPRGPHWHDNQQLIRTAPAPVGRVHISAIRF